jgi:uncharacterized protein involved in tolerance to divalent cations
MGIFEKPMHLILVYVTIYNMVNAEALAQQLVQENLVACVHDYPAIVVLPVHEAHKPYIQWMHDATTTAI